MFLIVILFTLHKGIVWGQCDLFFAGLLYRVFAFRWMCAHYRSGVVIVSYDRLDLVPVDTVYIIRYYYSTGPGTQAGKHTTVVPAHNARQWPSEARAAVACR